jgi:hypothetical protein
MSQVVREGVQARGLQERLPEGWVGISLARLWTFGYATGLLGSTHVGAEAGHGFVDMGCEVTSSRRRRRCASRAPGEEVHFSSTVGEVAFSFAAAAAASQCS